MALRLVLGLAAVAEASRARGSPRCSCDQHPGQCPSHNRLALSCVVASGVAGVAVSNPVGSPTASAGDTSYRSRGTGVLPDPRWKSRQAVWISRQGVECQQSLIPALITTGSYGKERKKRGVPIEQETEGYCVQFQLGPIPGSCRQVRAPHAQWTRYLTQGHMVCVRCEWPAQNARSRRCYGDGGGARGNQLLQWQAAGHPCCRGIWERLRQLRDCSCPAVHSLVFI